MSRTLAGRNVARRARTPVRMTEGQKITELVRAWTIGCFLNYQKGSHTIGSSTTHHIFSADREPLITPIKKKIIYENHTPTILAHKMEESFHEKLETARTKMVHGQLRAIVAFLITSGTCIYFYLKYTGEQQKERISKTASDIGRGALREGNNQQLLFSWGRQRVHFSVWSHFQKKRLLCERLNNNHKPIFLFWYYYGVFFFDFE